MLTRTEERLLVALRQRAQREKRQLFVAEGVRVVEELLASGIPIGLAVTAASLEESERGRALAAALARDHDVRRVPEHVLARVASTDAPQGVVVTARIPDTTLDTLDAGSTRIALVLDGIQDPGNVGTLVRSAHAFGAGFVLALGGTADVWNPKSVRATAGSAFRIPVVSERAEPGLAWLRSAGFRILAADARGTDVSRAACGDRCAIVVGNEGTGVSDRVREAADALVAVPIREGVESLNVAAAAAVLLYALTR